MRKYALLIGVSSSKEDKLPSLGAPTEDVNELKQSLEDENIGGFELVRTITSPDMTSDLLTAEVHWLFDNRSPNDLVLFYYSGHGIKEYAGDLYFALPTTDPSKLATAYRTEVIRYRMGQSVAGAKIVILDCCHSGAFLKDAKRGGQKQQAVDDETFAATTKGRYVLTASTEAQYAFEDRDRKNSIFTRYLLYGLRDAKAAPDHSEISFNALSEYLSREVPQADPRMSPQRFVSGEATDLILAKNHHYRPPLDQNLLDASTSDDQYRRLGAVGFLAELARTIADQQKSKAARDALLLMRKPHELAIIDRAIAIALEERKERDPDEIDRLTEQLMASQGKVNLLEDTIREIQAISHFDRGLKVCKIVFYRSWHHLFRHHYNDICIDNLESHSSIEHRPASVLLCINTYIQANH